MKAATFVPDTIGILKSFGWTQKEIASEIGVTQGTLSRAQSGAQSLRRKSVDKLMVLLEREGLRIKALREKLLSATEGELE